MANHFDINIGTRDDPWGGIQPFGLDDIDAFQHVWFNGQTGTGKSAALLSMWAQVVRNGHGCTLIDLNGDLSIDALNVIPLSRRDDVVYCDPMDTEHVLPINPFYNIPLDQRPNVALDFTEAAKHIWEDSWGERMDWILRNVVAAILDAPEQLSPSVLSIPMMLEDTRYRKEVTKHIQNHRVRSFFENQFEKYSKTRRDEYIVPIQNKIGKILTNNHVSNILTPYRPSFQFSDAITKKSILIVRLSTGQLGTEPAGLLGSLTTSTIIKAALAQAAVSYEDRIPHFLFIDEQHNLKTNALKSAYSETRKYKLAIVSSTQYINQLDDDLIASMFGNIGTIVAFRSSATDADVLAKQIGKFPPEQYTDLGLGEVRVRLLTKGSLSVPFRGKTIIDPFPPDNKAEQIQRYVRERYTKPRKKVEQDYLRWAKKQTIPARQLKEQRQDTVENRKAHWQAKPAPASPPDDTTKVTAKGLKLIKEIGAIAAANRDRHALTKKPTRRKQRRSDSQADV